jgi:hypothetical protein
LRQIQDKADEVSQEIECQSLRSNLLQTYAL